jgi:hypothetical protein
VYGVRCTVYGVRCTVYGVRCTVYGVRSVRAGTLNRYLSATLKERLRARGTPKLEFRSGHFLEVVIVDFSSAGRHQENFGRTSTKGAQATQSAECPL